MTASAKGNVISTSDPAADARAVALRKAGETIGACVTLVRARGRRWEYVAGSTDDLPVGPPRLIPLREGWGLMVYRETALSDAEGQYLFETLEHL